MMRQEIEKINDIVGNKFKKILIKTIFKGGKTLDRLSELYDPKQGYTSKADLVLYDKINFHEQNNFIQELEKITSTFKKLKDKVDKKSVYNITHEKSNAVIISSINYLTVKYFFHYSFLNNISKGLNDWVVNIDSGLNIGDYPKGTLNELKKNLMNLKQKLDPIKSLLSTQITDLSKTMMSLSRKPQVAYPTDFLINSSSDRKTSNLASFMMDDKYTKADGLSSSPINSTNGHVKYCTLVSISNVN